MYFEDNSLHRPCAPKEVARDLQYVVVVVAVREPVSQGLESRVYWDWKRM